MELYIHIPFCVRKCTYCSFTSFPGCSQQEMERYLFAVLREAQLRKHEINEPLETVYIGGGTPSLIPAELFCSFLSELKTILDFSRVHEFTTEANPGTVTPAWLDTAVSQGINRISFGVQAFQDQILQTLGRIHRSCDVAASVKAARESGMENISLDLMFGIPGQKAEDWAETLHFALSLCPDHISAYGLIPEDGTPLSAQLDSGILELPDPDSERNMYDFCIRLLAENGFEQYEISNFSRPGYACRHNIGYWDQVPYLGLGLSAASMLRPASRPKGVFSIRTTNPDTLPEYYRLIHSPVFSVPEETISLAEARFETVMLSLRMTAGMNRKRFRDLHGAPPEAFYGDVLRRLASQGLLILKDDSWRLTRRGMDIQNSILLEFMEDMA